MINIFFCEAILREARDEAPFYTVPLKPVGTRPQCPDEPAAGTLRRGEVGE